MPARVWDWRWTFARIRRTSDGVGARKFRLKRSRAGKHIRLRRCRCGSGPQGNVLVERISGTYIKHKHTIHRSHFCCIPIPNVLVERRSFRKHISHTSHLRCVPTPNVVVERRSSIKRRPHISHLCRVPTPNVLVERRSGPKHISHIRHSFCIPLRNVAVECTFFIAKSLISTSIRSTHIRHQTRIPIWHRPVIITRRPHSALAGDFGPCFR